MKLTRDCQQRIDKKLKRDLKKMWRKTENLIKRNWNKTKEKKK